MAVDPEVQDYPMLAIQCPDCKRKHITPRCEEDPNDAVRALILCPDCCADGFGTTTYINAAGAEIEPDTI